MSNNETSPDGSPLLQWTSFPLIDRPLTSIILAVALVLLAWLLWQITVIEWHTPLYYVLGMIFVLGSLITWFIPTHYCLWPQRVEAYYVAIPVRRAWSDFRCWYADRRGIMLGTFPHQSRLDRFRGLSLRFSKTRAEKDELITILTEKIGKHV